MVGVSTFGPARLSGLVGSRGRRSIEEMAEEQSGWRPLELPSRRAAADGASRSVDLGASPFSRLALAHVISGSGDALVTLALAGSLFFNISPTAARGRVALSLVL